MSKLKMILEGAWTGQEANAPEVSVILSVRVRRVTT